ncbi:MAG: formyl transferase [Gammaproteobacteria bacterium]|nr:formyl transferase [Gammaproteobacteria bacterium]NNC97386.1 formyl transferase [Gammaproteobacteria bacterium]NNM13578.1 formyl transferase [Gammaproteobacteria bacterium]
MKILIFGHYEIASNYAISQVVEALADHQIQIVLSGKGDAFETGGDDFSKLAHYEQELSNALNQEQDELGLACKGFDELAKLTNNEIGQLANPNSKTGLAQLKSYQADLFISIRYRKIFKPQAIAIPPKGVINLHSGLLPKYRGAMATFWAMLNGDEFIGSTLHYITDKGIDTGPIIATAPIKCDYDQSYLENVLRLYPSGCQQIVQAVQQIEKKEPPSLFTQPLSGNYYSFPDMHNLNEFFDMGFRLM